MRTLAFISQKGDAGKTTLTVNTAVAFQQADLDRGASPKTPGTLTCLSPMPAPSRPPCASSSRPTRRRTPGTDTRAPQAAQPPRMPHRDDLCRPGCLLGSPAAWPTNRTRTSRRQTTTLNQGRGGVTALSRNEHQKPEPKLLDGKNQFSLHRIFVFFQGEPDGVALAKPLRARPVPLLVGVGVG